jgi:signal transduction histidine kinase
MFGRTLSITFEPILDDHKRTFGFIRVMRDVNDEFRRETQLLNAERFATLGQILAGIAHDVGTPLNIISGYSEFLLMRAKPDERGYKELSTILQQTRRIATLFGEALDLARLPQGRSDAIDLNGLLAGVLNLGGHYLRKADVKAVLTCRIDSALIYGEAPQLKQAFFNLVLNASQQVGTGGRLEIVLDESADRPGFLTLELWGTEVSGVGHDFSQSLALFFGASRETGIVGLGLSLARKILNEAGAEITSSTRGAGGAPLVMYLPVNVESSKA